jgi:hypothetical protein
MALVTASHDGKRILRLLGSARDRCRSAILDIMLMGPLLIGRWGASGAGPGEVEGDERQIHGGLARILASPQKFGVDRTDLVEHVGQLAHGSNA